MTDYLGRKRELKEQQDPECDETAMLTSKIVRTEQLPNRTEDQKMLPANPQHPDFSTILDSDEKLKVSVQVTVGQRAGTKLNQLNTLRKLGLGEIAKQSMQELGFGDGHGTCFTLPLRSLPEDKLAPFRSFCQSQGFISYCESRGLRRVEYSPRSPPRMDALERRFLDAIAKCDRNETIAIVFHGTPAANISSILENGLDPNRRKGQAFGPGEYFGRQPDVSLSYTRGCHQMLVFAIVLNDSESKGEDQSKVSARALARRRHVLFRQAVVENNSHQMPLGVVSYSDVNQLALRRAEQLKQRVIECTKRAGEAKRLAQELRNKAEIIQLIIREHFDCAEDRWNRYKSQLSALSTKEISLYAHRKLDSAIVECLFPDLPSPPAGDELEHLGKSVEEQEQLAQEAEDKLNEALIKQAHELFSQVKQETADKSTLSHASQQPNAPSVAREVKENEASNSYSRYRVLADKVAAAGFATARRPRQNMAPHQGQQQGATAWSALFSSIEANNQFTSSHNGSASGQGIVQSAKSNNEKQKGNWKNDTNADAAAGPVHYIPNEAE